DLHRLRRAAWRCLGLPLGGGRTIVGATMTKQVYFFGAGKAEGNAKAKDVLGGKGAGLAEMTNLGIPVPPGFTITTSVSVDFMKTGHVAASIKPEVEAALKKVEEIV